MESGASKKSACPRCGGGRIIAHGKRHAVYPIGCLMVFAFPIAWLHGQSTPHDFECAVCGARFARRTAAAKVAHVALWAGLTIAVVWTLRSAAKG